jgi:hypothetical protein
LFIAFTQEEAMMRIPIALLLCVLAVSVTPVDAQSAGEAQANPATQAPTTGTVISSSRTTLVVRTDTGDYKLFELNSDTTQPAQIAAGATVAVTAPAAGAGTGQVPIASAVRVTTLPAQGLAPKQDPDEPIPASVKQLERSIQRQTARFRLGVRAGAALDPELIVFGAQSQIGPFFNDNIWARPNIEFGFGEVTDLIGLNFDGVYRVPVTERGGRWGFFLGGGPVLNFVKLGFTNEGDEDPDQNFSFDDFDLDVGLNILAGVQSRAGMFMELKTTVYANPGMRFVVGTSF